MTDEKAQSMTWENTSSDHIRDIKFYRKVGFVQIFKGSAKPLLQSKYPNQGLGKSLTDKRLLLPMGPSRRAMALGKLIYQ